jgi:hypothetical protein
MEGSLTLPGSERLSALGCIVGERDTSSASSRWPWVVGEPSDPVVGHLAEVADQVSDLVYNDASG